MSLQIGGTPLAGCDDPLGLLMDCHRRIERFLETLQRVVDSGAGGPLDAAQREALDVALRYFAGMAVKHTADEEDSLFPRLAAEVGTDGADAAVVERMAELEADHREAEEAHAEVEQLGRRWLADDRLSAADLARLRELLDALTTTYREHIAHEDNEVFPVAARRLGPEELAAIGAEMAARRGGLTCAQRKALERRG